MVICDNYFPTDLLKLDILVDRFSLRLTNLTFDATQLAKASYILSVMADVIESMMGSREIYANSIIV